MTVNNLPSTSTYPDTADASVIDTNAFFTNFYSFKFNLSTNVNDAVQIYFQQVTGDIESAKILAATVIYTSLARGTDPMAIIEKFKNTPKGELDLYVATFLNLNRVNTSLLGVKNKPRTGFFVQRSVRA